jgi:hypothetical protein
MRRRSSHPSHVFDIFRSFLLFHWHTLLSTGWVPDRAKTVYVSTLAENHFIEAIIGTSLLRTNWPSLQASRLKLNLKSSFTMIKFSLLALLVSSLKATAFVQQPSAQFARPNMATGITLPSSSCRLYLPEISRKTTTTTTTTNESRKRKPSFSWRDLLPPPPEDQLILMGDITMIMLYSFSSHVLNNMIVESVFDKSESLQDALNVLDPLGEIVTLQAPVWTDASMTNQVLMVNAQQSLSQHWCPLFSTAGAASVALCSAWLFAGWVHRAFLFQNTLDCDTTQALNKTLQTWMSTAGLLLLMVLTSNSIISNVPLLQSWLGCANCGQDYLLTKADSLYIIDSLTVLLSWRFIASVMLSSTYR